MTCAAADRHQRPRPLAPVPAIAQVGTRSFETLDSMSDYREIANITAESIPDNMKKDCILFYTPDTEALARKIAETAGGNVTLGDIRWK